ncbi:helix-turn-helix transcriptional regulator [Patulibacter sp. NPDC049589]|uniref:helix-turn-helix transcriptional regulator n=1 Tax=Patulibacter sp. NPDC049589 TaxID=3154731 RepID=UPI003415BCEC
MTRSPVLPFPRPAASDARDQEGPPADAGNAANLKELGRFLRAHRERTTPEDVGLPVNGRRRTPGLRREEVAALSGVGLAWYSWIEQGRVAASKHVLEAIGRTLRLEPAPSRHLLALAGHMPPPKPEVDHEALVRRASPLLDAWPTSPALLLDRRLDITAWNAAYAAVWSDPAEIAPERRNLMWTLVGDPAVRSGLVDPEPLARAVLAQMRMQTAPRMDDPRTQELYEVLNADFPELHEWWTCQGVADLTTRRIEVRTPGGDELRLDLHAMRPVDDPEGLVLLQAPVGPADHEAVVAAVRAGRFPISRTG